MWDATIASISETNENFFTANGREMQRMINTHIEASKIGRHIAEQVLDYQRRMSSSDSSPDPDPTLAQTLQNEVPSEASAPTSKRLNGTHAGFTTYHRNNSNNTVVSESKCGFYNNFKESDLLG